MYKWIKIPKLEFSHYTNNVSTDENQLSVLEEQEQIPHKPSACKKMCERCKVFFAIYQILLARQGPIQEFTLEMNMDRTCVEINHMISHLSRNNAVKKLKLHLSEEEFGSYYWIPLSIFSLQQLTDLYLFGCDFNLKPMFSGFGKLTSLYLKDVYIPIKTLFHLVSNCPLLKTFTLHYLVSVQQKHPAMKAKRLSKDKRLAKAKRLSLDIISTLPENIIETILCRLSTQEAVRTSILSRDWRYKWTKIPKLEFSKYSFEVSTDDNQLSVSEQTNECKMMRERCKVFRAIYQVLSLHQGPITDFTLDLDMDKTCFEINDVIRYLSRNNAVKKLKLELSEEEFGLYYWIPLSIFSLQQLTDLHLCGCVLNMKSPFFGFHSLTSLYLENVYIYTKTLLHLVSNCPLLKTFTLLLQGEYIIFDQPDDKNSVIELLECFPKIENLTTWSWITECFVLDAVPQELPVLLLIHLKYVSFTCMSADGLYFLAFLMRCSPNMEKIEIEIDGAHFSDEMISIILKAYSDIWLEHLNELNIVGFSNVKPDLEFVKFILAKSPKLEKVYLLLYNVLDKNVESEMLRILSHYAPASEEVQVTVQYVAGGCTSVYTIQPCED